MKPNMMRTAVVIVALGVLSLGLAGCGAPEPPPPTATPKLVTVHTVIIKVGTIIVDENEVAACVADPDDLAGVNGGDTVLFNNTTAVEVHVTAPEDVFSSDEMTFSLAPAGAEGSTSTQTAQDQTEQTGYEYTVECTLAEPDVAQSTPRIVIM